MSRPSLSIVVLMLCASLACGQTGTLPPSIPDLPQDTRTAPTFPSLWSGQAPYHGPALWISAEYLLWTINNPTLPPLVTSGNPSVLAPNGQGAIGAPGTQILYGNSPINYGPQSGVRINLGGWVDTSQIWGVEANGFFLNQGSANYNNASNGTPALYVPAFNTNPLQGPAHQGSFPIADVVAGLAGNVSVTSSSRLWGGELNGIYRFGSGTNYRLDFLYGLRYLNLQENLSLYVTTNGADGLGNPYQIALQDSFGTQNQFYGGQIGARFAYQQGRFSAEVTGKIAIGLTHGEVDINGQNTASGPGVANVGFTPGTTPGGIFSQPSNIGSQSSNAFSAVPSLQLKLGWDVCQNLRATVGYDAFCWTNVLRPSDQIDRNVNTSQTQYAPPGTGMLVGPSNPSAMFNHSTFFAQGVSFGLEFRY